MQRAFGTVLISVLVVLAGCSGVLGGDSEPTETLTPAAVPTDEPTPTPVPQFAPGVTGKGIENASALVAAHASFLQNRSFTTTSNTTVLAPNGSVVGRYTSTLRAGRVGEGTRFVSERNDSYGYSNAEAYPVRTDGWSNGGRLFLKRTYANGTTTYDREWVGGGRRFGTSGAGLRFALELFDTTNTSVSKREGNGTMRYLVRGNTQSNQEFRQGKLSLRLLVDSRGVIRNYRTVRRTPSEENTSEISSERRYSAVGGTKSPERPSWVEKAMNRTTPAHPVGTVTEG